MTAWIKGAARLLAVACAVWIAVLWRWRAAHRAPDAVDLVLHLAVLPVVVFGLATAARRAVAGALARQDARTAARAAAAGGAGTAARAAAAVPGPTAPDDPEAAPSWHLLGAWTRTAAGTDARALLAATAAGAPRPVPDAVLQDDEGFPVMAARIPDLPLDGLEDELRRIGTAAAAGGPEPLPERALRALACLSAPVDGLVAALPAWVAHGCGAGAPGGGAPGRPDAASAPVVQVLAAWPQDWSDATCAAADAWLSQRLRAPLAALLPPGRWSIQGRRLSGAGLLDAAERTLEALRRQERDDPVVLLACHSDLDAAGIRALEERQALFHPRHRPRMPMAGEGAAALAVSARAHPAAMPAEGGARFAPPALARRADPIDAGGRTDAGAAVALVERSLAAAGVPRPSVAALASDADQHTARATELFAVALALLPDLDAREDLRLAGTVSGRLGAAAPLAVLAMAAAQVRATGRPAVALSLADPHERMAAVLRPGERPCGAAPPPAA